MAVVCTCFPTIYLKSQEIIYAIWYYVAAAAYIKLPNNFVDLRLGIDCAFIVDIVTFFDVVRIQGGSQLKSHSRQICKKAHERL